MNRTILTVAGVLSASSLLLVDSAVKGTVLLALAAVAALILRRDSAATRHLVWLLAIVAMLVVPVLSAVLPQWRVLPAWMSSPRPAVVAVSPPSNALPAGGAIESPQMAAPAEVERPSATAFPPVAVPSDSQPVPATRATASAPTVWNVTWINALPLAWAIGFSVLMLRLSAARWMLWNSERLATVIRRRVAPQLALESRDAQASGAASAPRFSENIATTGGLTPPRSPILSQSRSDSATAQDPIVTAMEAIRSQLGIGRPVALLIHPHKTIPVVWGILRCRLMLPAEARQWSDEQLRSVLLHELAHIKRRDTVVQLLTQIACALHWFNPLVWFAAWRLDVERERSCDDLVLASGIRPSAYAGHLLDVVTGLSPARWTQACGLAMARKSSLEGRLTAVLGKDLNRRGVSVALAGLALAIAVGVAVPIAMLRAADEKREDVTQNSKSTFKLRPETIAKLKWGEPMNGLRMALAWPPVLGEPAMGDEPEFYLVVQNVSQAAVRLTANDAAPNPRKLLLQDDRPVAITVDDVPIPGDWLLQPREAAFVRLFHSNEKREDGRTLSAVKEQVVRVIPKYSYMAEMSIEKAPAGAWTGKLFTGATRGSADVAAAPAPMHKDARALYEIWLRHARGNGDIPGGLVGELAGGVRRFIRYNPTWKTVPTLNALLPRLDGTRNWKPADAIALLDEIAAIQDSPLSMVTGDEDDRVIVTGKPLPKELADKEWLWGWGKADASGLRIAWDLQPRDPRLQLSIEEGYLSTVRLGTALKGRLLVHNSGDKPVVLRVPTWYQGSVTAVDKDQKPIEIPGISWTTLSSLVTHRLAPGDYVVIPAPGIGFGKDAGHGPWAGPRVGWNVMAKPGDRVPLTLKPVPFDGSEVGRREDRPFDDGPNWWPGFIKARFARELPLPATAAERARMLERALRELFDSAPSDEERDGFGKVSDEKSLAAFAEKLAQRPGTVSFAGSLAPASAWFNIAEADPNADKQPRVVLGPGEYPLPSASSRRGNATLKIVGKSVGKRHTNDAQLLFEAVEFTGIIAPEPHKLEVPDGRGTWAIVCRPNDGFFYVLHKGTVRKIDYSKPRDVTDAPATDLPAEFRDEVKRQLEIAGVSAEQQAEIFEKPAPPAATADRDAVNAVRTAAAPGRYELGDGVQLQVRQVTENGKPTNSAKILFLSPDPKVQPKVPHLEKLPVISSTNRAPTQKAVPGEPYDIGFYSPNAAYAFVWQRGANTLWVTEIREGPRIPIWKAPGGTRPGPQTVTLRSFDFSNPADVKLTHVTSSENGGDWSWGKIVPAAFHQPVLDALGERGKRLRDFIEPQKEMPTGASAPKLSKLPDDAYAKPGVHCQKFREEDAKRPGGELMGSALESSQRTDHTKEPLVLGVRTASDAQWRIGGTAKMGLIVRNRTGGIGRIGSGRDVKFSYTGRLDNGLSVVAVDEAGKEHAAAIAHFDGLLTFQRMLLPVAHVATIKEFTLRFDAEKRGVSEPHVAAFHLPPGKYKLRCKWNDARPDVAHEGEWMGELVNEEYEFNLAAAVAAGQESAPGLGEIVLHAIDVDTNKPIPNVTFVKENALREDWATPVGRSDADGTVRIETKPLPGYFFSILPVPQGYKVTSLDEVPAQVKVGGRVDYRFHLRKRGTNLDFVKEVPEPKSAGTRFADALKDSNKDVFQIVIHDMPGFRGKPVTFSFARKNALLAERIFANGELVRAAVHDELRYFQKAEGKLAGDISELSDIKIVDRTVPSSPATSWYLHCRTKDGIELKQDGFGIRFEDLRHWDLEIPAFLHPEF